MSVRSRLQDHQVQLSQVLGTLALLYGRTNQADSVVVGIFPQVASPPGDPKT